jgi:uncharacterized protein YecA (UPF0149 family)
MLQKYSRMNSEDFVLLNCGNWTNEDQAYFEEANSELKFFQTNELKERRMHVSEFPLARRGDTVPKTGRNHPCPCGSGKKFKRCHGASHD